MNLYQKNGMPDALMQYRKLEQISEPITAAHSPSRETRELYVSDRRVNGANRLSALWPVVPQRAKPAPGNCSAREQSSFA